MDCEQQNGIWVAPCDLCNSLEFEMTRSDTREMRRCLRCGLVRVVADRTSNAASRTRIEERLLRSAVSEIVSSVDRTQPPAVLLIGTPSDEVIGLLLGAGIYPTLLAEGGMSAPDGVTVYDQRLEGAPFMADQFDAIISVRPLDSYDPPSLLFTKTRLWLTAEGLLILGGVNWGGLERRLWRERWLRRNRTARYLMSHAHLKEYAERFGFEIASSGTRSRLATTALMAFGSRSKFARLISLPICGTANVLGLGYAWWGVLVKRGVATKPLLRRITETETAPGLAAAGYGAHREMEMLEQDR